MWDTRAPGGSVHQTSTDPWPAHGGGNGNANGGGKPAAGGGGSGLQGSKWVSALAADPGGNFVVAGGGVEQGAVPGGKGGFVAVFHLPSMAAVSAAATPSFVQDVCFLEDKVRVLV